MASKNELVKCVIVGDSKNDQLDLLNTIISSNSSNKNQNTENNTTEMTDIFDHKELSVNIKNHNYILSFFLPSGNEEYDRVRPLIYQGTDVYIITFEIDNIYSFSNIKHKWHLEITSNQNITFIPFILVGLKSETRINNTNTNTNNNNSPRNLVGRLEAEELCRDLKGIGYCEFSYIKNEGHNIIINKIIQYIDKQRYGTGGGSSNEDSDGNGGCCLIG